MTGFIFVHPHLYKSRPGFVYQPRGLGVLHYLGMAGRIRSDDPHFGDFQSD